MRMLALFICAFITLNASSAAAATADAASGSYPSRPIRLVVPFGPGVSVDAQTRIIAEHLHTELGQPVTVENRPGVQGALGTQTVAESEPDGHTLLLATNGTHATNVSLFKQLPYDPVADFAPIGLIGGSAWTLIVPAGESADSIEAFLAKLRAEPGRYNGGYTSASSQVALSLLKNLGKADVVGVPYKGVSQALSDLIGGSIDFMFIDLGGALAQQKGGKVKALAVSSLAPSPAAPSLPTLNSVIPGYEVFSWSSLVAPAGTPRAVIDKLNAALNKVLQRPDVRERFTAMGFDLYPESQRTPEALARQIKTDIVKWGEQVKAAGIQPE